MTWIVFTWSILRQFWMTKIFLCYCTFFGRIHKCWKEIRVESDRRWHFKPVNGKNLGKVPSNAGRLEPAQGISPNSLNSNLIPCHLQLSTHCRRGFTHKCMSSTPGVAAPGLAASAASNWWTLTLDIDTQWRLLSQRHIKWTVTKNKWKRCWLAGDIDQSYTWLKVKTEISTSSSFATTIQSISFW